MGSFCAARNWTEHLPNSVGIRQWLSIVVILTLPARRNGSGRNRPAVLVHANSGTISIGTDSRYRVCRAVARFCLPDERSTAGITIDAGAKCIGLIGFEYGCANALTGKESARRAAMSASDLPRAQVRSLRI